MRKWLFSMMAVLVLGVVVVLGSCGARGSFVVRDGYYDPYYYGHDYYNYYNGYWRGDYVYWRGDWYLRGIGTPYYDDWYDPYPYWW